MKVIAIHILLMAMVHAQVVNLFEPHYTNMTLSITDEGVKLLSQLDNVVPVTVIGPRKSGKSFLMNSLTKSRSFKLGHNGLPETRGIQMMERTIQFPKGEAVFIDTEGLSSNPLGYDKNIILFALTSSSHVIINVKNELLFNDILSLSAIAQLAEYYKSHQLTSFHFPALTWVIEDYNQAVGSSEHELLFNHYLVEKPNPEHNKLIDEYNLIVRTLRSQFPVQRLFLVPEPIDDVMQFTSLDTIKFAKLSTRYTAVINNIIEWLKSTSPFNLQYITTGRRLLRSSLSVCTNQKSTQTIYRWSSMRL